LLARARIGTASYLLLIHNPTAECEEGRKNPKRAAGQGVIYLFLGSNQKGLFEANEPKRQTRREREGGRREEREEGNEG
jgi:hypothetical protein